ELWADYVGRVRELAASAATRAGVDPEMLAVILLGATMLWSLRVQSGAESAAATARYRRELKRLMLYGVVRPEAHGDLVGAGRRPRGRQRGKARRAVGGSPTQRERLRTPVSGARSRA